MNIGDKVYCIRCCRMNKNSSCPGQVRTTVGKIYEVQNIEYINNKKPRLMIIDDKGHNHFFPINGKWFLGIKEYRKKKLDKINETSNM